MRKRPVEMRDLDLQNFSSDNTTAFEDGLSVNARPVNIAWSNLSVDIELRRLFNLRKNGSKQVLKGVSGHTNSGQLLAILGGSGSGKTTLLNVLAGRPAQFSHISGRVSVNGRVVESAASGSLKSLSGYVTQDDHLLPNLTVRETLEFAALLKLPATMTRQQQLDQAEATLRELRLTHCADTIIGNEHVRGVSGGERRRVSIGLQLLTNPSLLFLDEPTSGLDSTTARNIVQTLVALARKNRTVICTIHQPRSDIFRLFDSVMLLSQGELAYFGPSAELVPYFAECGYKCPLYSNPADFALDLVTVDYKDEKTESSSHERLQHFVDAYAKSDRAVKTSVSIERLHRSADLPPLPSAAESGANVFRQFATLYVRATKNILRDRLSFVSLVLYSMIIGLLFGGISYNIGYDQTAVMDRRGVLSLLMSLTPFFAILSCIVQWHTERMVYTRERQDGMYSTGPYYWSKFFSELPVNVALSFAFVCVTYWMLNLNPAADRFFIFFGIILLATYCSQSWGFVFAALIPNFLAASTAANAAYTLYFLPSGWVVNYDDSPVWLRWVRDISYLKYAYEVSTWKWPESEKSCFRNQVASPVLFPAQDLIATMCFIFFYFFFFGFFFRFP
eukprot:TRINITY_DN4362_c0_g1_i1.p1 TRINITY_DN4362_c0_g1~~TRINITY_DN4362_c0_g1_i1.p1  ORF type:complete len:619 (-),score=110.30 TRINITY_DN4362_c0_g1_i1:266-2122(-)